MAGGRKLTGADGNTFSSTNQPANRGRKPRLVSHINAELKAEGYEPVSNENVLHAFTTLINLPLAKISAIANKEILYKRKKYPDDPGNDEMEIVFLEEGDKYPMLYRLAAKELVGKRGGEYLEKLLDRSFGRAKQAMEVTGKDGKDLIPATISSIEVIHSKIPNED